MTGYAVEQNGKVVGVGIDPVGAVKCALDNGAGWDIDSAPLTVKAVDDETYCRMRFGAEDGAPLGGIVLGIPASPSLLPCGCRGLCDGSCGTGGAP